MAHSRGVDKVGVRGVCEHSRKEPVVPTLWSLPKSGLRTTIPLDAFQNQVVSESAEPPVFAAAESIG
jgi:hypothetical protein